MRVVRLHENIVSLAARQMLDMMSPSNFLPTNPALQDRMVETGGRCFADGARY